jgi:hypothetical protein
MVKIDSQRDSPTYVSFEVSCDNSKIEIKDEFIPERALSTCETNRRVPIEIQQTETLRISKKVPVHINILMSSTEGGEKEQIGTLRAQRDVS